MQSTTSNDHETGQLLGELREKAQGGPDQVVAARQIVDLLLDLRIAATEPQLIAAVDETLAEIGRRPGVLLISEVRDIHDKLVSV